LQPARAIALLIGLSGSSLGQGSARLNPATAVVLPDSAMPGLLAQCTRVSPATSDAYWRPTAVQVATADSLLAPALAAALPRAPKQPGTTPRVGSYARQYGGLVLQGKRVLYVNGAYLSPAEQDTLQRYLASPEDQRPPGLGGLLQDFAHRAVRVCDGGASYFGVVIDLEARRVGTIQFNEEGVVADS
jgi:hypothetical protein